MATIINEKSSAKIKKIKYGIYFASLILIVLILFVSVDYVEDRFYYFIIFFNILLVLAAAYFGVKFFLYLPCKDPDEEYFNKIKSLSNNYNVLTSIIINDEKCAFFEFVIVSPNKIYFVNLNELNSEKQRIYNQVIGKIIEAREIKLNYKTIYTEKEFDNLIYRLSNQNDFKTTKQQEDVVNLLKEISI